MKAIIGKIEAEKDTVTILFYSGKRRHSTIEMPKFFMGDSGDAGVGDEVTISVTVPPPKRIDTTREKILRYLGRATGPRTATEICRSIPGAKLESVSGILKRMADSGVVERVGRVGPRGGFGYLTARAHAGGRGRRTR